MIRNGGSGARDSTVSTYDCLTGRITSQSDGPLALTAFNYTKGGDRKYVSGLSGSGRTESQYYYRADGLLIAVDNRSCAASVCKTVGDFPPQSLHGAFEDYRYDALGRRVLVRTRKDSVCEGADCESSMMWLVFDGSAIAAEIRGPGADGLAVDTLEAGAGIGVMYGTAEYLNGPTLDEPLEIQGILPYRTWRGLIDGGQCLDGICGSSGTIDYPGLTYEAYLTVRPSDQSFPVSWHGSLFAEGQDDGGLDANLVKAVRYVETTHGYYDAVAAPFDRNKTVLPMNVNTAVWGPKLGYTRNQLKQPENNIRAGATILKQLVASMPGASVAQIATRYNAGRAGRVTNYGARVQQVYKDRSWTQH